VLCRAFSQSISRGFNSPILQLDGRLRGKGLDEAVLGERQAGNGNRGAGTGSASGERKGQVGGKGRLDMTLR